MNTAEDNRRRIALARCRKASPQGDSATWGQWGRSPKCGSDMPYGYLLFKNSMRKALT